MEVKVSKNTKTYHSVRNEFSEAHYDLPPSYGMFDIDIYQGKWLDIKKVATKTEATYVEYRCLKYDNTGNKFDIKRFNPIAIFELKHHMTDRVFNSLSLPEGSATWAAFMFSKIMNCRFFMVIATNGSYPFEFYEYNEYGNYNLSGKLDLYPWEDRQEVINEFWNTKLNIS
jgi:hypothetical protein